MKVKSMLTILLIVAILLSACSEATKQGEDSSLTKERFVGERSVYLVTDTSTGCEYIRTTGSSSSWTYVHGSCQEVIAEEYGLKNLDK